MSDNNSKKQMTDEERLQLAAKLDKELDEFIESLPKRQQPDGEPDENWLEEFDKHPFFMKKAPEPGEELHPLYEGLQQLKYDPNENTPEELANSYKEDGNFNFKHKNYRLAILAYTEGIKVKCESDEVNANLYNNRAAANWFLKNYRSCIRDCELALKLKPDYTKVLSRAANAAFACLKYEKAIEFCEKWLETFSDNKEALELRQKSVNAMKAKERDDRKRTAAQIKKQKQEDAIFKAILSRNIKIESGKKSFKDLYEPFCPDMVDHRVLLNDQNELIWPIHFVYPEYQIMDLIKEFCENELFIDQINTVFAEVPEWDKKQKYHSNNLNVYFENVQVKKIFKVNLHESLLQTMQNKSYVLQGGNPAFIIFVKNSTSEKEFLNKY